MTEVWMVEAKRFLYQALVLRIVHSYMFGGVSGQQCSAWLYANEITEKEIERMEKQFTTLKYSINACFLKHNVD